jgi:hypothetical protein
MADSHVKLTVQVKGIDAAIALVAAHEAIQKALLDIAQAEACTHEWMRGIQTAPKADYYMGEIRALTSKAHDRLKAVLSEFASAEEPT